MALGLFPDFQYSPDAAVNPNINPFVSFPPGMTQRTVQPIGPTLGGLGTFDVSGSLLTAYRVLGFIGGVIGTYHGYKRHNGSIPWALGWGALGSLFAPIVVPIAYAQGIGKPLNK